jgi:hypothetical protein
VGKHGRVRGDATPWDARAELPPARSGAVGVLDHATPSAGSVLIRRERVVPAQRSLPGCSEVVHLRSQDGRSGIVILILNTPEHARQAAPTIATPEDAPITIHSTAIHEVSAHA